jgi:hypothetical protein
MQNEDLGENESLFWWWWRKGYIINENMNP